MTCPCCGQPYEELLIVPSNIVLLDMTGDQANVACYCCLDNAAHNPQPADSATPVAA